MAADALSAGTAWICTLAFLMLAVLRFGPQWGVAGRLELLTLGAIAGFLVHNFPPARIFMGDAGSTLLGLLVGLFGLQALAADLRSLTVPARLLQHLLGVLFICAVPLYDMTSVVLIRLAQGRSPFHPDRQHLSHRITDRGWSKPAAVAWIHGLGLASGAVGVLVYTWPLEAALVVALFGVLGWLSLAWYEYLVRRRQTRERNREPGCRS